MKRKNFVVYSMVILRYEYVISASGCRPPGVILVSRGFMTLADYLVPRQFQGEFRFDHG